MAPPSSAKIIQLRQLLEEQRRARLPASPSLWKCGDPFLDSLQIPKAALAEIVADSFHGPGGGLLLQHCLELALARQRVVLIDGKNSFDPCALPRRLLDRLLWLRCDDIFQAVRAADLVLRDGNISLVLLPCLLNPPGELKKIPSQAWHRLRLLAEKSAVTFLVFTPFSMIGGARLRLAVKASCSLDDLDQRRETLLPRLRLETVRRRLSPEPESSHESCRAVCA